MGSKKSIEERIEEIGKKQLDEGKVVHFTKTENINPVQLLFLFYMMRRLRK